MFIPVNNRPKFSSLVMFNLYANSVYVASQNSWAFCIFSRVFSGLFVVRTLL